MLDCCVVSDGGGACIVTTEERARDLPTQPVYVLGAAHTLTHALNVSQSADLTVAGAARSGPLALQRAGVTVDDIDVLQLYDSFTITVLITLEGLGFCQPGEGGAFVEGGRLAFDGPLPTNTDGGGLSACHPGMRGMFLIVEAVRQLRGEGGPTQVPDAQARDRARDRRDALDRRDPRARNGGPVSVSPPGARPAAAAGEGDARARARRPTSSRRRTGTRRGEGRLLIQRCANGHAQLYPRAHCVTCRRAGRVGGRVRVRHRLLVHRAAPAPLALAAPPAPARRRARRPRRGAAADDEPRERRTESR